VVVLSWIRGDYKCFTVEPFSTYRFDEFSHIDENLMPVEFSSFLLSDIAHLKKVIFGCQANETEAIARFLRETLEQLMSIGNALGVYPTGCEFLSVDITGCLLSSVTSVVIPLTQIVLRWVVESWSL